MGFIVPLMSLGRAKTLFGSPKIAKPKMSEVNEITNAFMNRASTIEEENAQGFFELLMDNIITNKYHLPDSEKQNPDDEEIPSYNFEDLIEGIEIEGTSVTISDENSIFGVPYRDIAYLLEYGRKDKGISPKDVFRKTFKEYKKIAADNILNF